MYLTWRRRFRSLKLKRKNRSKTDGCRHFYAIYDCSALLVTVISMQGLALAKSDGKQKQTLTIHVNMSVSMRKRGDWRENITNKQCRFTKQ